MNSKLDISLNWFVSVCDHVAWKYHIENTKPHKLAPMCVHCSLHTDNSTMMTNVWQTEAFYKQNISLWCMLSASPHSFSVHSNLPMHCSGNCVWSLAQFPYCLTSTAAGSCQIVWESPLLHIVTVTVKANTVTLTRFSDISDNISALFSFSRDHILLATAY